MRINDNSVSEKDSISKFIERNKHCMDKCLVLSNPPFMIKNDNRYKDNLVTLEIEIIIK